MRCSNLMSPEDPQIICDRCLSRERDRRRRQLAKERKERHAKVAEGAPVTTPSQPSVITTTPLAVYPLHVREEPTFLFPAYQDFNFLVATFRNRLSGFLQAQITYLQLKLHEARKFAPPGVENAEAVQVIPVHPMLFIFAGEYSIVADPNGGDMTGRIESVRQAVVETMGVEFGCVVRLLLSYPRHCLRQVWFVQWPESVHYAGRCGCWTVDVYS